MNRRFIGFSKKAPTNTMMIEEDDCRGCLKRLSVDTCIAMSPMVHEDCPAKCYDAKELKRIYADMMVRTGTQASENYLQKELNNLLIKNAERKYWPHEKKR